MTLYRIWLGVSLLIFLSSCTSFDQTSTASAQEPSSSAQDTVANDPETQLRALNLQIDNQSNDYGLFQRRSEIYFELDSLSKALIDIDRALKLYAEGPELHYWKGFLLYVEDDTAASLHSLRKAQSLGSKNPEIPYQIGQIFFLQQKYAPALVAYRQAAQLNPYDPQYIFAQGYLAEAQNQFDQATTLYKQSLGIDSTFDRALTRLHDIYLEHYENETEAMKHNQALLRYKPGHPLGRFQEGNYHLRRALSYTDGSQQELFRQHINDAVLAYTITVNRDSNFAQAWYNRGFCYFLGEGRLNEAIRDFEKAIQKDSTQAPAYFMLGSIMEQNGDLSGALEYYQQALAIKPESRDFRKAVDELEKQIR